MNIAKTVKDPIYGYISLDDKIKNEIIYTPNFQRLRDIIQTSYSYVFPSAVHNRFVHSLGVYFLGCIVSNNIINTFEYNNINIKEIERSIEIFKYACLLHDIGHAPFSHIGEAYYLNDGDDSELYNIIIELTKDEELEILKNIYHGMAAPHELMSAIVGLKIYSFLFESDEERGLFARCITGYLYDNTDSKKSFYNCLIKLLNSSLIDVDKIDYLLRDSYVMGYDITKIDYTRLLNSIKIKLMSSNYELIYTEGAKEVIENVIYAHDTEKKWIQNNPEILYESFLIKHAVSVINKRFEENKLFSYDFLTCEGGVIGDWRISLLNDGDIKFLMKNIDSDYLIDEFFLRVERRVPLWKSETEYMAIFGRAFDGRIFSVINKRFEELNQYLNKLNCDEINEIAIMSCRKEILRIKEELLKDETIIDKSSLEYLLEYRNRSLVWLECLRTFAEEQRIAFDFKIITTKMFNSGFLKDEIRKIKMEIPSIESICNFVNITNVLTANNSVSENFFYLFYRKTDAIHIDVNKLASMLGRLAIEELLNE